MKKIMFILWVSVVFCLFRDISAQEPYVFARPDGMNVRWMYYPQDTTAMNDTIQKTIVLPSGREYTLYQILTDGREYLEFSRHLIDADTLYVLYHTGILNTYGGTFLEKLDLKTGKSYWNIRYDGRHMDNSETPHYIYKERDNRIVILGFRGDIYGSFLGRFYRRVYDTRSGRLIEHTFGERDAPNTPQLRASWAFRFSHLYPYKDTAFVYHSTRGGGYNRFTLERYGPQVIRYVLDKYGRKLDSSSITILDPAKYYFQYMLDIYPAGKDTLVGLRSGRNALSTYPVDTLRREHYLEFMDAGLKHLKTVDINTVFDSANYGSYMSLRRVTPHHIIVHLAREKRRYQWDHVVGVFDYSGNLLDRIVIDTLPGSGGLRSHRVDELSIFSKSRDEVYLAAPFFIEKKRRFEFVLMSKKFGEDIRVLGRWRIDKRDIKLSPKDLVLLDDGDILMKFMYERYALNKKGEYILSEDQHIWGKLSGDILLSNSNLFTPLLGKSYAVTLYPNPSNGLATVVFDHDFTGDIAVTDGQGNGVLSVEVQKTNRMTLSLQHVLSGVYYLRAVEEDGTVYHGKLVVR